MPLKVWIVNPYGSIPGEGWREHRSTMIAKTMEEAGHEIIWWVANFEHRSKKFRSDTWKDISITPKFLVRLVPTSPYTSHISLKRVRFEKLFSKRFYKRALDCEPPDVIILAEPALFTSGFVLKYVKAKQIKLIVDVLDLWPELFHICLLKKLSGLGRVFFMPFYRRRAALFRKADGIVGVTKDYLNLALGLAGPKKYSAVIYCGVEIESIRLDNADREAARLPEVIKACVKEPDEIWTVYAGTFGANYDIKTILEVAGLLEAKPIRHKLILAGDGPLKDFILSTILDKGLNKTIFIGNVCAHELPLLYRMCDIALSSYVSGSTVSMPLKAFDYLAAGLPIINSLERELGEIIKSKEVGLQYKAEDPHSLFEAIESLCINTDLRLKMRDNALKLAAQFDRKVQYSRYVNLVEKAGYGY